MGRPNWQFGADYIGKKILSQKSGELRYMEILNGFADQEKHLITPQSTLEVAILVFADNIYLTILHKKENRYGRVSL